MAQKSKSLVWSQKVPGSAKPIYNQNAALNSQILPSRRLAWLTWRKRSLCKPNRIGKPPKRTLNLCGLCSFQNPPAGQDGIGDISIPHAGHVQASHTLDTCKQNEDIVNSSGQSAFLFCLLKETKSVKCTSVYCKCSARTSFYSRPIVCFEQLRS